MTGFFVGFSFLTDFLSISSGSSFVVESYITCPPMWLWSRQKHTWSSRIFSHHQLRWLGITRPINLNKFYCKELNDSAYSSRIFTGRRQANVMKCKTISYFISLTIHHLATELMLRSHQNVLSFKHWPDSRKYLFAVVWSVEMSVLGAQLFFIWRIQVQLWQLHKQKKKPNIFAAPLVHFNIQAGRGYTSFWILVILFTPFCGGIILFPFCSQLRSNGHGMQFTASQLTATTEQSCYSYRTQMQKSETEKAFEVYGSKIDINWAEDCSPGRRTISLCWNLNKMTSSITSRTATNLCIWKTPSVVARMSFVFWLFVFFFGGGGEGQAAEWQAAKELLLKCFVMQRNHKHVFSSLQVKGWRWTKTERRSTQDPPSLVTKYSPWKRHSNKPSIWQVQNEPDWRTRWGCPKVKSK